MKPKELNNSILRLALCQPFLTRSYTHLIIDNIAYISKNLNQHYFLKLSSGELNKVLMFTKL